MTGRGHTVPQAEAQPYNRSDAAPRTVTVLGSTGSIGKSTVDLLQAHRAKFNVRALTAHKNVELLAQQARDLQAERAVIGDATLFNDLKNALQGSGIEAAAGDEAIIEAAGMGSDWTMAAIVGAAGVRATLRAIQQGGTIALANKESLVCAGPFMLDAVTKSGATLLPVDSEHNAVFQVFDPLRHAGIARIILTASGGPFLRKTRDELRDITPAEAIRHPTWSMGAKISIDSATMMNKSLEIIEAAYLFNVNHEKIDVLIHPQSTVHSMVEYIDGSILAQMGAPDMRTPIAHCLAWPDRMATTGHRMNLQNNFNLSFEPIDNKRFPAVVMARQCLDAAAGYPTALNAANETAVAAFLDGRIRFSEIENLAAEVLQRQKIGAISSLADVFEVDRAARALAADIISGLN